MQKSPWKPHKPLFASPVPKDARKPKKKWRILPVLWSGLKRICMVLGAMMILSSTVSLFLLLSITGASAPDLPEKIVLFLPFKGELAEQDSPVTLADPFATPPLTVSEYVKVIDHAAADPRVEGILARLYDGNFSLAHIYEIRMALKRFRASGKFAHIYSSSYGGGAGGLARLYLASAFDEIWMQPMGIVSIAGLRAEVPFFRNILDKIGIYPQFYQRKEFKNAYESLTNKEISPENKMVLKEIIAAIRTEIISTIPPDLGMSTEKFETLLDKGLFTARDAQAAGLITHDDYIDVLSERLRAEITGDPESEGDLFVGIRHYIMDINPQNALLPEEPDPTKKSIALIYAAGAIMETNGGAAPSPMGGRKIAAADEIAPAIIEASKDENIEAIILRVNSPGGSPVASESILRALEKAKMRGKKVIVSMGPLAASGGYWISTGADRIFALPTTLTGSIGVVGGKFSVEELWKKMGVNWDGVQWGKNAGIWSMNTPFSETEEARINMMLDEVYRVFLERVAKGRNMSVQEVDKIARGHVWTGAKALEIGLVDEIGGLHEALNYTATLLGAGDQSDLNIQILPQPKTPFEQIIEMLGGSASVFEGLRIQNAVMELIAPLLSQASIMNDIGPIAVYEPLVIEH